MCLCVRDAAMLSCFTMSWGSALKGKNKWIKRGWRGQQAAIRSHQQPQPDPWPFLSLAAVLLWPLALTAKPRLRDDAPRVATCPIMTRPLTFPFLFLFLYPQSDWTTRTLCLPASCPYLLQRLPDNQARDPSTDTPTWLWLEREIGQKYAGKRLRKKTKNRNRK